MGTGRAAEKSPLPLYRQIAGQIAHDIRSGSIPPGTKLPTVRELSEQLTASRGTVKHAYEYLAQAGLIVMRQGHGTFVCEQTQSSESRKERAMQLLDSFIDEMESMDFSLRDIRIFFDLKMMEREDERPLVRLGVVDCNPETLLVIHNQLMGLEHAEVGRYLLEDILANPESLPSDLNLVVTTSTHAEEVCARIEKPERVMRTVLAASPKTIAQIAQIAPDARVGVLAKSSRFAAIVTRGYRQIGSPQEPDVLLFDEADEFDRFIAQHDALVTSPHYASFCSREQAQALSAFAKEHTLIGYDYHIDRGSALYIGEQVERLYRQLNGKSE